MSDNTGDSRRAGERTGRQDSVGLLLEWAEAPWDTAIFGSPVLQIHRLEVRGPTADLDMMAFEAARDNVGSNLVSCRLSHECLRESIFLEDHGFRFIEMLFQPELDELQGITGLHDNGLMVRPASNTDLPDLLDIAGSAFRNERFHIDPRLDSRLGDQRYRNWVSSSLEHSRQRLYVIQEDKLPVAFFVTEQLSDGTCYWHLNAVTPAIQGKGYGRRAWLAMLHQAQQEGATRVSTSIVARNHRVLNLYARLHFRFPPPLMTFHWVRST